MGGKENIGKHRIQTGEGPAELEVHHVGPYPIIRYFLDKLGFIRMARSHLGTSKDSVLDPGLTLSLLIQEILVSPLPLYKISEWVDGISTDALGITKAQKKALNDDRVARVLETLASVRGKTLFFQIALRAIKCFELDCRQIHNDTTTITFHGAYKGSVEEPRITWGVNKDYRPDLKQLVFGLNVTRDGGVPISHQVYSGNRTDDTIHLENLEELREILGRSDFIYVADSKLCTKKNLANIERYHGKFVTVLPRTWKEDKAFRKALEAGGEVRWRKIHGDNAEGQESRTIWSTNSGPEETPQGYRIIWYRDSRKKALDAAAREESLKKTEEELRALVPRLNRGALKQRGAIKQKVQAILKKNRCEGLVDFSVVSTEKVTLTRLRRGRPRKGDPLREVRTKIFHLEWKRNKAAIKAKSRTDGVFPLITNLSPREASKEKVFLIYKDQALVERRHKVMKSDLVVAPVYVKKTKRVQGILHATFLALVVYSLIEREARKNMERMGKGEIPILPESRSSKSPTTSRILEIFRDVSWYEFKRGEEHLVFPLKLTKLQKEVLGLLGMDPKHYI